jgi:DNA-binding MarR family transcriptional regulator
MPQDSFRPPTLVALTSYLAGSVARIGNRYLHDALAEHGLRLAHYGLLTALDDFGPQSQRELSDRLDIDQSHLVGYLDHIDGLGLASRERDPDDRRRYRVALTDDGRRLVQRLHPVARESQDELLGVLSDDEREALVALLTRILCAHDHAQAV